MADLIGRIRDFDETLIGTFGHRTDGSRFSVSYNERTLYVIIAMIFWSYAGAVSAFDRGGLTADEGLGLSVLAMVIIYTSRVMAR